uniref:Uncharacterized protein n=1 Tax=Candidatus Kentrum sp. DK TaxID=2126562 RepID=A0A450RW09_9GAMM|nr:MAG: hypothetical protein BECKDK2373B_GA0170837_10059 [Candidatus Kentron sp. DK]
MMINRSRIPSVTLLTLTDAITGMIGILLIVLVLARPPEEMVHRLQQADAEIACETGDPPPGGIGNQTIIRLLDSGERMPLEHLVRQIHFQKEMSVRLVVAADRANSREAACLKQLHAEVNRLNKAYEENRAAIRYPYVFLSVYYAAPALEDAP